MLAHQYPPTHNYHRLGNANQHYPLGTQYYHWICDSLPRLLALGLALAEDEANAATLPLLLPASKEGDAVPFDEMLSLTKKYGA